MLRTILRDLYAWDRADHARQLAAAGRDDPRAGRRPGLAPRDFRPAQHPPHLRRARPARRAAKTTPRLQYSLEWALLHPLPMGRVRHRPVRAGTLLGPAAGAAFADRRPAAGQRPRDPLAWTTSMPPSSTTSARIPYDQVIGTATGFSTRHRLPPVSDAEMEARFRRRGRGRSGRARHLCLVHQRGVPDGPGAARREDRLPVQPGAEPMPYETGSILRQRTIDSWRR